MLRLTLLGVVSLVAAAVSWAALHDSRAEPALAPMTLGDDGCAPDLDD